MTDFLLYALEAPIVFGFNTLALILNTSELAYCNIYEAVVLPSLLYVCETWTLYQRHIKQPEAFHLCSLRSLCKIKWQDKIPNIEVLARCGITGAEGMTMKAQFCWDGHVIRTDDTQIPKTLFLGQLSCVTKCSGCPPLIKLCKIETAAWHTPTQNWPSWWQKPLLSQKKLDIWKEEGWGCAAEMCKPKGQCLTTCVKLWPYMCVMCNLHHASQSGA